MKGKIYTAIVVLLLVAGLAVMLYPTVSDAWNARLQADAIREYADGVQALEDSQYGELLAQAQVYNADLAELAGTYALSPEMQRRYATVLSTGDSEILAYVEIPSISVMLPIARGTEEKTLQKYVGHLEWSALPIGGEGNHSVISGHRGLPSSELFTHIDRLEMGDRFYIHVLGQTLEYAVDNIAVVEPHDFSLLDAEPERDYVTLITCTPYGINSHRLLVRGARVHSEIPDQSVVTLPENTGPDWMILIPAAVVLIAAVVIGCLIVDSRKQKRKGSGGRYEKK